MKSKSIKSILDLLRNKYTLYFVLAIAVFKFYSLINANNIYGLLAMVATCYIATFFTKNMIYVLGAGLVVTQMFDLARQNGLISTEGFAEMKPRYSSEAVKETAKNAAASVKSSPPPPPPGVKENKKYPTEPGTVQTDPSAPKKVKETFVVATGEDEEEEMIKKMGASKI